jgi:transmembrane sensor
MNNSARISDLAFKYLKGELDAAESEELNEYLAASEDNRLFFESLINTDNINRNVKAIYEFNRAATWQTIVAGTPKLQKRKVILMRPSLKYAAAVILVAALGAYVYMNRHHKPDAVVVKPVAPKQNDLLPGGNKATLTLAGGKTITLDNAGNGNIATQGNTEIIKTADGQLAYNSRSASAEVYFNTVSTPKGGQYQLTLADGTKIWMNAASALRFPTAFTGTERLVELDGEAYFEVAKNAQTPFIIKTKSGTTVQVLGTHFNIMAYRDEQDTKTTLLEGSVKVAFGQTEATLKPGQQAISPTERSTAIVVNKHANIEEAIAWKNGVFQFNDADLKMVMRQIARWYDVEISYEGNIPEKVFTGSMARNLNASELLSGIEFIGVKFRIDGKKIVVHP